MELDFIDSIMQWAAIDISIVSLVALISQIGILLDSTVLEVFGIDTTYSSAIWQALEEGSSRPPRCSAI